MFDFFNRLKYSDPQLWVLFKHWPVAIFLPSVLVLIACLALVTRMWDERQRRAAEEKREVNERD